MGFTNGLRVFGLTCLVTFAGVYVQPASVAAADPTPSPAAESPSPSPDPSASQSASPTTDPAASPTADPSASPAPTPTPTVDPSPSPSPGSSPSPTPTAVSSATTLVPATVRPNYAAAVRRIALAQRGKRYAFGAMGPNAFDCSGLVRFAYRIAGVTTRLGGGHSARGMLYWARIHGRASRSDPRVGDVVIYGRGSHAAIYIGNGLVISALNPRLGIRVTRLRGLTTPFTTFIHTRL